MHTPAQRTFYTLVATQTLSQIGTQMTGTAIGIWLFKENGMALPLLMVMVFQMLPNVLAGSLAGVLVDRWPRKLAMMVGDAGQAVPTFFLMLSFATGHFETWQLYLSVTIQACFAILQGSAFSSTVPLLMPGEQLERANSLAQVAMPTAGLLAPMLAGMLFGLIGVPGIMLLDISAFVIAVVVVSRLSIPQPQATAEGQAAKGSFWKELSGSWAFLWSRKQMLGLILFATFANLTLNSSLNLATPYTLSVIEDERIAGLLWGLMSGGMLAGAITFAAFGRVGAGRRVQGAVLSVVLMGLLTSLWGLMRSPIPFGLVVFSILFTNPMANSLFASLLQTKIPPDMQGRVFALSNQLAMLLTPPGLLTVGLLVDNVLEPAVGKADWWQTVEPLLGTHPGAGMGLVMVVLGLVASLGSLAYLALPSTRRLESDLPDFTPTLANATPNAPQATSAPMGALALD
jgi:MFS family permease